MPALQYDPTRLAPLRASAAAALRHLLAARSADPAAASALRVTALVGANLEHHVLPAVDRLIASDAMLSWLTTGPAWARGLAGRGLGLALAERAAELSVSDDADVDELTEALRLAADDEAAMAAFFGALEPAGLLRLVTNLASADHRSIELPLLLRKQFVQTAARAGGIHAGYGRRLIRAAVVQHEQRGPTGDAGLVVSFLVHGGDLPTDFLVAAIDEAVVQERAFAARSGLEAEAGWTLWLGGGPAAALGLWLDFDEPYRGHELDALEAEDPMYALLGQLARDGGAGRVTFTDPDRAGYLFSQRDVLVDDGRAIVQAAAAAAAGPDVVPTAPRPLLDDASLVASAFVNLFGRANAARVGRDERASTAAARIVGVHAYGVEHALGWVPGPTDAERVGSMAEGARPALVDPQGAIAELAHDVFGGTRSSAVFDPEALGHVVDLAARTDAGVVLLREDLANYQRGVAEAAASRVAAGEIPPSQAESYLAEAMRDAAHLEGQFVQHVGHEAERRGRGADEIGRFWIGAIGTSIQLGAGVLGPGGSAVVGVAVGQGTDIAQRELPDAGDRAAVGAERMASVAAERLAYLWLRELHAAGVLRTGLPASILVDGKLPAYDDLVIALVTGGPAGWTVATVLQELDDAPGGRVDLDGRAMVEAMAAAQQDQYVELAE